MFPESPHFSDHFDIKYSFWQTMELRLRVTESSISHSTVSIMDEATWDGNLIDLLKSSEFANRTDKIHPDLRTIVVFVEQQ